MEITDTQLEQADSVARKHGLEMVLVFGSAVDTRLEHTLSDLDIAIRYTDKPPGFEDFAQIQHDLQQVFPGREVDIALLNHADPLFLKKIMENCLLLYGDSTRLCELKIYAYKRYQDHRRFLQMEREYVERFLDRKASSE